jgi:phosphatidate phosphatase APP1
MRHCGVTDRPPPQPVLVRAALTLENALGTATGTVLRRTRRYRPMIIPFVGHGTPERAQIGGRVILGPAAAAAQDVPSAQGPPRQQRRSRWAVLRASMSRFLTVEAPDTPVTVRLPGAETTVRADQEGYIDTVVELPRMQPGWHEIELAPDGGRPVSAALLVVDPRSRVGLVSDVDDTILETGITRGLEFVRTTLLIEVHERTPLPGASALYRALVAAPDGFARPVFYVSTSPWNLHEKLLEFIALQRFPKGPLLLTDWGPGHGNLFRIGARDHKLGLIRRLLGDHPSLDLVLIGDTGQADPEIYAALAQESPRRIRAIYVRRTLPRDERREREVDALSSQVTAAGVPMLAVDDSEQIAVHAASIDLLDEAALAAFRAEAGPPPGNGRLSRP